MARKFSRPAIAERIDYYVRREDTEDWPCPWITPDGIGSSSEPEAWEKYVALDWIRYKNAMRPLGKQFRLFRKRGKRIVQVEE